LFPRGDHVSELHSRDRGQKDIKREKLHHREVLANHNTGTYKTDDKTVSARATVQTFLPSVASVLGV
jgi:hypothetical protein